MNKLLRILIATFILLPAFLAGFPPTPAKAGSASASSATSFAHNWAVRMGGVSSEASYFIAVDGSGNIYTTGYFWGTADFDPGSGTYNLTSAGESDIFVSKLDKNGNFVWAKRIGGKGTDEARAVALDWSGNLYITGIFQSTVDFDPGPGTHNLTNAGGWDIFVSKLDGNGNFKWAKRMGGTGKDFGEGIAVDRSGNVYTTGVFSGHAYFYGTYPTSVYRASAGSFDIYVTKMDTNGNFFWASAFGGTNHDSALGIAVDGSGNIYTTGRFSGRADFYPGSGTYYLISTGSADIFVSKLGPNGGLLWARGMGGSYSDSGKAISVDGTGNVYTTGFFSGTVDFDPGSGTHNLISAGDADIFVSKLGTDGNFLWARRMGGSDYDGSQAIAVDGTGNVYTTGFFSGKVDFDPGSGTHNLISAGDSEDIFVSKLGTDGNFLWARQMGGSHLDVGLAIAVDGTGNVYTTGQFDGTADFDPGPGTVELTSAGSRDVFVSKLTPTTSTTLHSQAHYDGWVLEKSETSGKGGSKNNQGKVLYVGDDASNKQYRGMLSFDTSSIPDDAVITSVALKVKKAGLAGTNPFKTHKGLRVDIRNGKFGTKPSLQVSDFQAKASQNLGGKFSRKAVSKWYTANLGIAAYSHINVAGITQFRLRFYKDDNNDNGADILKLYSGNAVLSNRPQLIVEYYVP